MKAAESLGYWTLPKPEINQKAWSRIPRVARTTPFGYEVDEENDNFLLPIDNELELLFGVYRKYLKEAVLDDGTFDVWTTLNFQEFAYREISCPEWSD